MLGTKHEWCLPVTDGIVPCASGNESAHGMRTRGKVRIIAGRWRRRLLPVPDTPGLRPTPDRVRETLFNWLAADLPGARCLDLFAGTGVLGLEAASRGASRVVLVERDVDIVAHLRRQVLALGAGDVVQVERADAGSWAPIGEEHFDVVFVDPPYGSVDFPVLVESLLARGLLTANARIFIESEVGAPQVIVPAGWRVLRERRAGRVRYHLVAPPEGGGGSESS